MRKIILISLCAATALTSLPAYAQDVIMRRPIPHMDGRMPDPNNPPTPQQPGDCPEGHLCTPADNTLPPNPNPNEAHGWRVDCEPDPAITCMRVWPDENNFEILHSEVVPNASCARPNFDPGMDELLHSAFGLLSPGPSIDITEYCNSGANNNPPLEGRAVFGYSAACSADGEFKATCYKLEKFVGSYAWTISSAYPDQCEDFTPESSVETAALQDAGLFPHYRLDDVRQARDCPAPGEEWVYDPTPNEPPSPVWGEGQPYWETGPWEGSMTCGETSTVTREVRCMWSSYTTDGYTFPSEEGQHWQCEDALGEESRPASAYSGKRAGCGYRAEVIYGEWQAPPPWLGGGSATCSPNATRHNDYICLDGAGERVSKAYCKQGLTEDGYYKDYAFDVGNFSSCTAQWEGIEGESWCDGPREVANVNYVCMRSDGTHLTGADAAACDIGEKPLDGTKQIGTCVKKADYVSYPNQFLPSCGGTQGQQLQGTADHENMGYPIWSGADYRNVVAQCIASGSSCCAFASPNGMTRAWAFSGERQNDAYAYVNFVDPASPDLGGEWSVYAILDVQWRPEDYIPFVPYHFQGE